MTEATTSRTRRRSHTHVNQVDKLVEQVNRALETRDEAKQEFRHFILNSPIMEMLTAFVDSGYDEMDLILQLSKEEVEEMLDCLAVEAEKQGLSMKPGQRVRVRHIFSKEKENMKMEEDLSVFDGREIYAIVKMFHLLDWNKSGYLDRAELAKILGDKNLEVLMKYDKNRDNRLSIFEWVRYWKVKKCKCLTKGESMQPFLKRFQIKVEDKYRKTKDIRTDGLLGDPARVSGHIDSQRSRNVSPSSREGDKSRVSDESILQSPSPKHAHTKDGKQTHRPPSHDSDDEHEDSRLSLSYAF